MYILSAHTISHSEVETEASALPQVCGDSICSQGESVSSCPRDCAPSVRSPTTPTKYFLFFGMSYARSWQQGRQYCQMLGGDLASVWSAAEFSAFEDLNRQYNTDEFQSAFLGWNNLAGNGQWTWSDGSSLAYTIPWGGGQPDNYMGIQDQCARYDYGVLDDIQCSRNLPFMCSVCTDNLPESLARNCASAVSCANAIASM
jgi:hypothetical protein